MKTSTRDSKPVAKSVRVSPAATKRPRWNVERHARWQKQVSRGKLSRSDWLQPAQTGGWATSPAPTLAASAHQTGESAQSAGIKSGRDVPKIAHRFNGGYPANPIESRRDG